MHDAGKTRFALARAALAALFVFASLLGECQAVTLHMLPIGDVGNAIDPRPGAHLGAVNYRYSLDKFDVTNAQYVEFLNATAALADPYGLYDENMAIDTWQGGIIRTGSGPFTYSIRPNYDNKPVTNVSWFDAVRFANWLTNGQGNGDTESGSYLITGGGPNSGTATIPTIAERAAWAATSLHYLLPTADEWYKAAYYKGGGTNAGYWNYPLGGNFQAVSGPPGTFHGANVSQFPNTAVPGPIFLTDVGAYASSTSPYGHKDMGGNVYQFTDTVYPNDPTQFILRGSPWTAGGEVTFFQSSESKYGPGLSSYTLGFRIAMVPEPGSVALFALATAAIIACRMRRRVKTG